MFDNLRKMWNESAYNARVKRTRRKIPKEDRGLSRPSGWLLQRTYESLRNSKMEVPQIKNNEDGTITLPDTWISAMCLLARWDSLLMDFEKDALDQVYDAIWPMGELPQEHLEKSREAESDAYGDRAGLSG